MRFWTVDAFTAKPFRGNPAAVFILDAFPSPELMQKIATEINLPATVFLLEKSNTHHEIRCFTPLVEVELCGHGTLAAAHVLWEEEKINRDIIYFDSLSGILVATQQGKNLTLDFPAYGSKPMPVPEAIGDILGVAPVCVNRAYDDCIIELHSVEEVTSLAPNINQLREIDCRGVIVTAEAKPDSGYDFVSRFFSPRVGVTEDPVTGSAHCKLAPYWAKRLGKTSFLAYQASRRGGSLSVRFESNRVYLTGQANTMFEGHFLNLSWSL